MISIKAFYCLLIFGVVVCQYGEFKPTIEGSGSGEVDSGSTVNTTMVTKIITNSLEDTTVEVGSGDDEDSGIIKSTKPASTMTKFTMPTTRPDGGEVGSGSTVTPEMLTKVFTSSLEDTTVEVGSGDDEDTVVIKSTKLTKFTTDFTMPTTRPDGGEGSGMSGDGSGEETFTDPSIPWNVISVSTPKIEPVDTFGSGSRIPGTTQPNVIHVESTKQAQTTEDSYLTSSKGAETKRPYTTMKTIEADPVTDIEVINSPTANLDRSTAKKTSTMGNVFQEPTEDPNLYGNTAKSSGNRKSEPAISFTTGIIIGVVVGALLTVLVILLLVYRLRKKDEGSYSLEEPITGYTKQEPGSPVSGKEYFA